MSGIYRSLSSDWLRSLRSAGHRSWQIRQPAAQSKLRELRQRARSACFVPVIRKTQNNRNFTLSPKMWETCGKVILRKMPLSYLRGIFERCLAVLKWSILIGIITLKHALQCAIRHISQLLIRVIPKKCCQMLSRGFLPHFRQHNRLILWRLTKIIIIFLLDRKIFSVI